MKTLDELIKAQEDGKAQTIGCDSCVCHPDSCQYECELVDALHYLKEYKKQKYIWKKLYLLAHRMFWGLEEEYPLDGHSIENDLFDAYSEGFEDEDA